METTSTSRTQAAMTLLEVTVALTIMVLGTMSVFSAMTTANDVHRRAKHQGLAEEAIQAEVEALLTQGWSAATAIKADPLVTSFAIPGLPTTNTAGAGSITKLSDSTSSLIHLVFTARWEDFQAPMTLPIHYYVTAR